MRGRWLGVALAACGTLLAAGSASAGVGTVDCANATLPQDKLMCASPELAP